MLIDAAIARITNGEKRYDANGAMATSGRVSERCSRSSCAIPISRRPPKTTVREHYGAAFVDSVFAAANERKLSDADILATVTDFTAQTIAAAIHASAPCVPARLIVGRAATRNSAHGGYCRGAPRRARAHERGSRRRRRQGSSRVRGARKRPSSPGAAMRPAPPARARRGAGEDHALIKKVRERRAERFIPEVPGVRPGQWSNRCARLSDARCAEKRSFATPAHPALRRTDTVRSLSGEPFRQDEEIVLRRNGFFFAENGCDLRFMQGDRAALDRPAQITDARKARRARASGRGK